MKYRFVLLDVDGTLLDFHACEVMAFRRGFEDFHLEWSQEIYEAYHGLNDELWRLHEKGILSREELLNTRFVKLFQRFGIEADGVEFERVYHRHLGEGAFPEAGALDLLKRLKDSPCRVYIVTNGLKSTQENRLKMSGIDRYVEDVFISEEIGFQKPMKEYFNYCFARIPDFRREEAIIVGDSLSADILGGINAGIATCWYNPSGKPGEEIRPDMEIHSLEQVWEICVGAESGTTDIADGNREQWI